MINNVPSLKQEYASAICKVQAQDFVMTVEERVSSGLRNYVTMLCAMDPIQTSPNSGMVGIYVKHKQIFDLEQKNMGSFSSLLIDDLCW